MNDREKYFRRAEQLRRIADAQYSEGDIRGSFDTRSVSDAEYAKARIRLDNGGRPYGIDVDAALQNRYYW